MTQQQALDAYRAMFPEKAEFLSVERTHRIGHKWGTPDDFRLWDLSEYMKKTGQMKLTCSNVSWEHALANVAADAELFAPDTSPFEDEVTADDDCARYQREQCI